METKEIKINEKEKVIVSTFENTISYVSKHKTEKSLQYIISFNRKSDLKQNVFINAKSFADVLHESGVFVDLGVFNKTNESLAPYFSGAKCVILGVPYIKGQKQYFNPITNEVIESEPAKNDGISYFVDSIQFTKEQKDLFADLNNDIKQGIQKEREAIRQATANWLAQLL